MEAKQLNWQGHVIHYQTTGTGRPILLVHGFGEDSRVWSQQVDLLSQVGQVVLPDLPGSGSSPFAPGISDDLEAMGAMLWGMVAAESDEKPIVLGHSMGGYITLAMAAQQPGGLHAMGLIHSTAAADSEEKKQNRQKSIDFVAEHGAFAFMKTMVPNLFSQRFRETSADVVSEMVERAKSFSAEAVMAYTRAMIARPDRTPLLEDSPIPTLFVLGTEDEAVPMNKVLPQTHLPERSWVHILQECGHMGMLEKTTTINQHLLSFIQQNIG